MGQIGDQGTHSKEEKQGVLPVPVQSSGNWDRERGEGRACSLLQMKLGVWIQKGGRLNICNWPTGFSDRLGWDCWGACWRREMGSEDVFGGKGVRGKDPLIQRSRPRGKTQKVFYYNDRVREGVSWEERRERLLVYLLPQPMWSVPREPSTLFKNM